MTTKTNGNGNAGFTTQPKSGTAVKANPTKQLTEAEKAELERKIQLEEQQKYFDGLHNLTSMRRRYEYHKNAVNRITVEDEETEQFEAAHYDKLAIIIKDNNGSQYEIKHAYLVKLTCEFLSAHFDQKIVEVEDKIVNYGK
ncbi:MAG TPA: hypothetical protein VD908_15765 [Cytophagales bacterium]|nr:hypothetical protein [Cytophagales bacterium]